jgi:hypothetical protein
VHCAENRGSVRANIAKHVAVIGSSSQAAAHLLTAMQNLGAKHDDNLDRGGSQMLNTMLSDPFTMNPVVP